MASSRQFRADDDPTTANIRVVADLERRLARQRTWTQRLSDRITAVVGSLGFVVAHLAGFIAWSSWNSLAPTPMRFDPFPYGLLTFIVSLEGVLIGTFVLLTQNRMAAHNDHRDRLNLEVDLLAEQEMTLLIRMLRRISERLNVPIDDQDLKRLERYAHQTDVGDLARRLETELTGDERALPENES
jgi:uncharacterized membrane protein